MKLVKQIGLMVTALIAVACQSNSDKSTPSGYTKYVNTFVGTAPLTDPKFIGYTPPENWRVWAGLTYPGSALPNAMVQLSPITAFGSGAGYQYEDTVIYAFTHTNKGHWNLCNIPVLPVVGEPRSDGRYGSRFSHRTESASPGYYGVSLDDYQVNVQLTSTLRCGFHQYQFANGNDRKILFDLAKANSRIRDWDIGQDGDRSVQGFQNMGDETVFFYAQLNEKINSIEQDKDKAVLQLADSENETVTIKIGLSFVSVENAKQNLANEIGDKTFETIRGEADTQWEALLSKIQVKGGTDQQKEMFYSSLYRSFLWPALRSDGNGEFTNVKGEVQNQGFSYYTLPSLWDTYRNKLVLLTIVSPDVTRDVIKSLANIGSHTGFIPTFFHGDHAAPFIAGAYKRGITDIEVDSVYQYLLNNATKEGGTRPHIAEYMAKGYISTPVVESPHVESKAKAGVSKTLEFAYDDYALSLLAKELGDQPNELIFKQRSNNFKNVFDSTTNFMRGRLEDGTWVRNFDPQYPYYEYMYREANAWQVSFFAPHNMPGLVSLYGGPKAFEAKLDSFFTVPWNPKHIARNVSSFIGQYCHGNQPDHEAPFAYYFVNKPEKSQQIVDSLLNHYYGVGEHRLALCGMDDAGEMSAWYVFSALGLYPFSAADDEYIVSVSLFDEVRWQTTQGKEVVITTTGSSRSLGQIKLNGMVHDKYFVSHDLMKEGGTIEIITK